MLRPVGFWSYARQDDSHSDGHLSQLRAIVGKAISLRVGEEVRLFQDTEAIPFGTDWAAQIEDAISQTTFFVPVITPRFLKSESCRDEFNAFRHRMKALARSDLIFPIHYVDVDRLADSNAIFGDDLAALRRQQWIDFRPLQFEDAKSPRVRQWADSLATSVVRAMDDGASAKRVPGEGLGRPNRAVDPVETRPASSPGAPAAAIPLARSMAASDYRRVPEPDSWAAPASVSRGAQPKTLLFGATSARFLFVFGATSGKLLFDAAARLAPFLGQLPTLLPLAPCHGAGCLNPWSDGPQ